jgi:hypothetical protein
MTTPEHFSVVDDRLSPQPWMQLRNVSHDEVGPVSKSYKPADGKAKDELVQNVQTHFTNNTPMNQWVYGMVTQGGAQVTLQVRSRAFLSTSHGVLIAPDAEADDFVMREQSRFGVGADIGLGGLLATGSAFGEAEVRGHSNTVPLMVDTTGWFLVEPGEKFNARVEVSFVSDKWEASRIDGGDDESESKFIAGDLAIDLYAVPALSQSVEPAEITVASAVSDCGYDELFDLLSPLVDIGDTILAYVTTAAHVVGVGDQYIEPLYDAWNKLHSREAPDGSGFAIYALLVDEDTPDHFQFTAPPFVENIISLIPVAGGLPVRDNEDNLLWSIASRITGSRLFSEHTAPSLNIPGQGLIIGNVVFDPDGLTLDFDVDLPDGFVTVVKILCATSALILGFLAHPSRPTLDWPFQFNGLPDFGNLFSFSTLIPAVTVT